MHFFCKYPLSRLSKNPLWREWDHILEGPQNSRYFEIPFAMVAFRSKMVHSFSIGWCCIGFDSLARWIVRMKVCRQSDTNNIFAGSTYPIETRVVFPCCCACVYALSRWSIPGGDSLVVCCGGVGNEAA